MLRRPATCVAFVSMLSLSAPALAGNEPEKAQQRAEQDLLPKVVASCGLPLSVSYDGGSLRKNNQDISGDQTDGENQCNEPLRYIWYACKTEAGRAAVKAARISKVVCKGVPGRIGSLGVSAGTVTIGRAFEESQPYLRSRGQFEAAVHVHLALGADDPYDDGTWHDVASQPNPVTSTTTYCLVGGDKVTYNEYVHEPFCRRKQDAQVRCWKDGAVVIDLRINKGRKTGFLTQRTTSGVRRASYRDDKQHGEERTFDNGKLASIASFDNGEQVWRKELRPDGRLAHYTHTYAGRSAAVATRADGHLTHLNCVPAAKDDPELRKLCGFDGAVTTSIYDGTGKVSEVLTWKDGVLQTEGAGTSDYAPRSEVAFKEGKKQGQERVLRADGKVASTIDWNRGVKDGKEIAYADDGMKISVEMVWKDGELKQLTDWFRNGNRKLEERYDSPKKKRTKEYWDTGKLALEGDFVLCESNDYGFVYRDWCEDGLHKTYFEDGTRRTEVTYHLGKQSGPSRSWWDNGKPASVEEWLEDRPTRAKHWNENGKLISDDEFESDGSRKLKH